MKIDFAAFVDSLKYMGQGLLCIFIVTFVIIGAIYILNKLTAEKKSSDDKEDK